MLLARRLCEAGCGFVTVSDCGWDMHANRNSPQFMAGIYPLGHQVDHAVAAFIEDVRERGLSDKILLVVTGEMGRTPQLNKNGGRDHYGPLTPLLFAGGGLKMGQVIGQSDAARRAAGEHALQPQAPAGHDLSHAVRRRPTPAANRHSPRDRPTGGELRADRRAAPDSSRGIKQPPAADANVSGGINGRWDRCESRRAATRPWRRV